MKHRLQFNDNSAHLTNREGDHVEESEHTTAAPAANKMIAEKHCSSKQHVASGPPLLWLFQRISGRSCGNRVKPNNAVQGQRRAQRIPSPLASTSSLTVKVLPASSVVTVLPRSRFLSSAKRLASGVIRKSTMFIIELSPQQLKQPLVPRRA